MMKTKTYWLVMIAFLLLLLGLYALFASLFEESTPFVRLLILGLPILYTIIGGWLRGRVVGNGLKHKSK